MTDVETLQPHRRLIEFQRFGQRLEARRQMLTIGQPRAQGLLGVGQRQLLPARASRVRDE